MKKTYIFQKILNDYVQRDRDSINIGMESLFMSPQEGDQSNKIPTN